MADWFKMYEAGLSEERLLYAMAKEAHVLSVWVWILTECCRGKSCTVDINEFIICGAGRKLNVTPDVFNESIRLLTEIKYISSTDSEVTVLQWDKRQSDYCKKKNPIKSDKILQKPPRGEKSRGEKKRQKRVSADSFSSDDKRYKKYPLLKLLHTSPQLRGISLEQYLKCLQARSKHMDIEAAINEVVRRSELRTDIKTPGAYLDTQLGYWEKDHRDAICRRKKEYDRIQSEIKSMAETIRDAKADPDTTINIDRMKKSFANEFGNEALAQAEKNAAELLEEKR